MYDFDSENNRRNTNSTKRDVKENELPMWIADMDFKVPPKVEDALTKTSRHGIFSYTDVNPEYDIAAAIITSGRYELKKENGVYLI